MLIGYGSFALTFGITSSPGSSSGLSTYLTSSNAMKDGRSGLATSIAFDTGGAALSQYVEITVAVTSPLDTSPPWGVVGVCNVQGLPVGTKLTFGGVTQRLVADENGELNAWWLPTAVNGAGPNGIYIYNDVAGSASITPGATFSIGEIFVGRIMSVPTLLMASPSAGLIDTTVTTITASGANYATMRKPRRTVAGKLGPFTTTNAKGGTASTLVSGANPAGVIDVKRLRSLLATSPVLAVCDTPNAGQGAGTVVNGIRYSQDFLQSNFMLARPLSIQDIVLDAPPYWTWGVSFQQAT